LYVRVPRKKRKKTGSGGRVLTLAAAVHVQPAISHVHFWRERQDTREASSISFSSAATDLAPFHRKQRTVYIYYFTMRQTKCFTWIIALIICQVMPIGCIKEAYPYVEVVNFPLTPSKTLLVCWKCLKCTADDLCVEISFKRRSFETVSISCHLK
jgi:hypothetical protein